MNDRGVGNSDRPNGARAELGVGVDDPSSPEIDPCDRRSTPRLDVLWSVDCETEDTFLYAAITNISEMGIFVRTVDPLAVGTSVTLRFAPSRGDEPFVLGGIVQWINRPRLESPNPGMGIRFEHLTPSDRERIVDSIRTIAYLREEPRPCNSEPGRTSDRALDPNRN